MSIKAGAIFIFVMGFYPIGVRAKVQANQAQANQAQASQQAMAKKAKIAPKRSLKSQRTIETGRQQVSPAPKKEVNVLMSDPLMERKWDLQKINAEQAWLKFSKGSKDIVVAVIDTGIDIHHPDLKDNIWKNPRGEIPGNQKDDDGNGYVDDIYGWNFVCNPKAGQSCQGHPICQQKNPDPNEYYEKCCRHGNNRVNDMHGHGTHIAGIIGARGGNNIGLSGVAQRVSLMALKYYDPHDNGKNNLKNTVCAIHYAVRNGAHIINYSGGGLEPNAKERQAIKAAEKKGVLFVAAAGNEGSNIDKKVSYYPARYPFNNILPVTATNFADEVLRSSNSGKTVHGAAPGRNILSTLPKGRYGHMTGTSQATAVATGAAVLIMDYYKNKTAHFALKHLNMTGDIKDQLKGKTSQRRRLNIFKALQARGKTVNFMDQVMAEPQCRHYHVMETDTEGEDPVPFQNSMPPCDPEPFQQARQDVDVIFKVISIGSPSPQRETAGVQPDRNPSSHKKKTPFLKRWFWNKK